jgi:DNA-binding LytR/AlgR family response regulator
MLRVAIAEDDPSYAQQLNDYLERFGKEQQLEIATTVFTNGIDLVDHYKPCYDLILLDIEMPLMDGMTAAGRIRAVDPEVVLIFVTNMARYALKGYEVDAMDFILKPVQYASFALKLKKAVNLVRSREQHYLMVSENSISRKIPTSEILYIEVQNHQLEIHAKDTIYHLRGTLSDMEEQLQGQPFSRCSISYLVNLRNVIYVERDTVYLEKGSLAISRTRKKPFLQDLAAYVGGGFR